MHCMCVSVHTDWSWPVSTFGYWARLLIGFGRSSLVIHLPRGAHHADASRRLGVIRQAELIRSIVSGARMCGSGARNPCGAPAVTGRSTKLSVRRA